MSTPEEQLRDRFNRFRYFGDVIEFPKGKEEQIVAILLKYAIPPKPLTLWQKIQRWWWIKRYYPK